VPMRKANGMEVGATLLDIEHTPDAILARIRLEQVPAPPIAPAGLYALRDPGAEVMPLHHLRGEDGAVLDFETYDFNSGRALPPAGGRFLFRVWWAPHQLAAVRDRSKRWRRREFVPEEPGDPVSAAHDGDHRHCLLCWASISPEPPDDPEGFTDGTSWLCIDCHDRYVQRDLLRLRTGR
jgi:hypothetical protein